MAVRDFGAKEIILFIPFVVFIAVLYFLMYKDGGFMNNNKTDMGVGVEEISNESEKGMVIDKSNKNIISMKEGDKKMTNSGLAYEVIKLGTGVLPTLANTVEVHYHGTLEDGTVFDSSVERGETIAFGLGQVIEGWQEGLQLMPVGSKFKFTIPADLAYGERALPNIPAGSTLIFEVELFDVK